ncbi:acriflavine resistance protein E [Pseudomonas asuensis]|uniref:Acriflavine resistance protein E n=2 Tax=Pseudomonas asuensis TaxID=1825787 RepID=A0ABQ2H019_9PSED|nr:acriflavine resistance protein E [Pseudomonas asuensis]
MRLHMKSKAFLYLAVLWLAACKPEAPAQAPSAPPVEVAVVTLKSQPVPLVAELNGRTVAHMEAEVRPQVSGIITQRTFEEGTLVKAGQVLYRIEQAPYRASLNQAKASLANAQATLQAAKLKAERYNDLIKIEAVSQQEADDAQASYQQALATIAERKAAVESAQIDLNFTQITAPIAGRISKSSITPGALVTANQETALAVIRTLDPIYVDITQSSAALLRLKKAMGNGVAAGSTDVSLRLEDGSLYQHSGVLKFAEVAVDQETGSVTLRALFPNPEGLLLPGMYVRALLQEAVAPQGLLAPQQSITRDAKGNGMALVVNANNTVEAREMVTGQAIGSQWLIQRGLADGDRLIVEGTGKVKAGSTVHAVEFKPAGSAEPRTLPEGQ